MSPETEDNPRDEHPAGADTDGEWVTPAVSYVDPRRRFCDLCGRPIARRYWQTRRGGEVGMYCDPAHAALRTTYPMSSHAPTALPPAEKER
jgi:hypothetical protein